ncbi:hypothetical protein O988_03039 [Pseudogymnoascus sp. VKM F-3808]|nr:hypothetical protein O988_03039 [Pseudogymnoascus sp. VKM F-3808]
MGRLHISGNSEDSTSFKPLFTSQALALHDGMGAPHPSTTQIVQPVSVFGEIADTPRRTLSASSSSGISPLSLRESSSSSASSSGAAAPLQCSTTPSSGHAQAQGLHMGMAWAQSHRTQPKPRHRMEAVRQSEAERNRGSRREPREGPLCGLCGP